MLMDIALSEYGRASETPSPVSRMMSSFAADFREDTDINLGVGYVNERTIPREKITEALGVIYGDPQKYRAPMNYGGPQGSANLIQALKHYLTRTTIGRVSPEALARNQIVIGASGATSLLMGIAQVMKPGLVLTTDPMYYIYTNALERMGFELLTVPEDKDGIQVELLKKTLQQLGPRIAELRFFYIVSVSNPGCSILTNERRRELLEVVADFSKQVERKVPLILDKAYEGLIHDPDLALKPPVSALEYDTEGLVYELGTLSKTLAPALRIGYLIGPESGLMKALIQNVSDTGFSAPLFTQEIASWLLEHHISAQVDNVNQGYRKKAQKVSAWIQELLGPYLEDCRGGQAGFYYYLTFKGIQTREGTPFFKYLARCTGNADLDGTASAKKARVLYIPGEFCVDQKGRMAETSGRQLRISYGFEELDRIRLALEIMRDACEYSMHAS